MLGIPVSSFFKDSKQVVPADGYVLSIFSDATFMYCPEEYTQAFMHTTIKKEEIEIGMEYVYYLIEGELFKTSFTESHKTLEEKIHLNETFIQCSLFGEL